jgi:4-hydroxy-tetrahydrodipicolinate synthase
MKQGFFPALGTPLDAQGNVICASFAKQIEHQILAGASGLLVMGSMGIEPYIRNSIYPQVARCGVEAAKGQAPVLVGVMDTCISRVMDRVDALSALPIDGVVSTVPYYNAMNQAQVLTFYTALADHSKFPVYLYDLAVVTKTRTMPETVMKLWKHPNIRGIKTGNLVTARLLRNSTEKPANFDIVYSDLDTFDVAYQYGIDKNLDGMFAATPKTAEALYCALAEKNVAKSTVCLDAILGLRDLFVESGSVLGAFTYAMNDLGYEGQFHMDYETLPSAASHEKVTAALRKMGEL